MDVLCDLVMSAGDLYLFVEAHVSVYYILRHCVDVEGHGCIIQCTGLFGVWGGYENASHSVL